MEKPGQHYDKWQIISLQSLSQWQLATSQATGQPNASRGKYQLIFKGRPVLLTSVWRETSQTPSKAFILLTPLLGEQLNSCSLPPLTLFQSWHSQGSISDPQNHLAWGENMISFMYALTQLTRHYYDDFKEASVYRQQAWDNKKVCVAASKCQSN